RNIAEALHGVITAQGMTDPIVWHQNAAEVRMAIEVNAHQIENFALKPASAKPNRNERVNVSLIAGNAGAQANLCLLGNRSEVIVQFEPWLDGEAINASSVG